MRKAPFLYRPAAILAGLCLCVSVRAEQVARTWKFPLSGPGSYKVQVEHPIGNVTAGTRVKYSITVGSETRSRELDLIANRPFIPLIVDVPDLRTMQVAIAGMDELHLQRTRVYVYDANSLPPGEIFDPTKSIESNSAKHLRTLLTRPPEEIDLATTKLTIDKLIDPSIDIQANLAKIEKMAEEIAAMPDFGPSNTSKLAALKRYIYEPGAWNSFRPFQYDLDDPFGTDIGNKLLPTYLSSRKGNCVSMPLLFVILGQRLGIDVTAATAPKHILVKFRNEQGTWINLETTSGANPARDIWIRQQFQMTDRALLNGVYLEPLTKRETIALMATTLTEHYLRESEYEKAIAIADLILEYYPKNVGIMVTKGVAYGRMARQRLAGKYSSPMKIPATEKRYFEYLSRSNHRWFNKAEELGWRQETNEENQKYMQQIEEARKRRTVN